MARSVDEINQYIVAQLVSNCALVGVTINPATWSTRNWLRLICYTVAISQALLEQLQDLFIQTAESIQARSAASSILWVQDAMFKFQYSATLPQVLQFITISLTSPTGVPFDYIYLAYPIIDTNLRIVTACSVKTNLSNQVTVKVAKGSPFVALTAPEISAAQSYIDMKGAAGITYIVTSLNADKLYIVADIWYAGAYSAVIQTNVIAALDAFLQTLSITNFDGSLKVSDVEVLIRGVEGVNDVVLKEVWCREDAEAFGTGATLVTGSDVVSRLYNSAAGYLVQENTVGETFADKLNFIAQ